MATEQSAFNQTMLEELLRIQEKAELKMLQKVANRVKKGNQTPGWNEKKLSDMQRLRKEIEQTLADKDKLSKVWTSKNLIKSYDDAGKRVSKVLHQPHSAMKDIVPLRLQRLILETQNAISGTSFRILRNTMDTYRDIVAESTSGILVGTETRMQASQQMLNDFAAKGITGFTDKIGRKWELASYVEMATRTASSRAALQGHVDRSMELGQDLMMVSSHAATCPICAPWGGQIISISGKTANYPTLDMAQADGLFHPNCKHTLTVWDPELEGNIEHAAKHQTEPDVEKYNAIQKQRYNERKIREYKRVEAVAMDPVSKAKAHNKILEYQAKQRVHVDKFNLRRKYAREGLSNRTGDPTKATVITKPTKPIVNTPEGKGPSIVIPEANKAFDKTKYKTPNGQDMWDKGAANMKGLSANEKLITKEYIGNTSSYAYNEYLYSGNYYKDKIAGKATQKMEVIDGLKKFINKNTIPENMKLSRFTDPQELQGILNKMGANIDVNATRNMSLEAIEKLNKQTAGIEYTNSSFVSTSYNTKKNIFSDKEIRINIYADKGSKGLITSNNRESEVIFNSGSKFRVINFEQQVVKRFVSGEGLIDSLEPVMNVQLIK